MKEEDLYLSWVSITTSDPVNIGQGLEEWKGNLDARYIYLE